MKLSTAFLLVASAASASAAHTIRNPTAKATLLSKARRLEDNGDDEAQDEEYQFLQNYSLKLIGCATGEKSQGEDGEYEYSSVVFRLCPVDACDEELELGCKEGYGDYVVGINTFTEQWLRDKEEDMQNDQDDQWDMNEFAECREYENDQDGDDQNGQNNQVYYVGPACAEDGTIKLGFFSDYTCTTVPEGTTFEDISNGWSLPYEDGGLISSACEGCAGYNENGEWELSEMCADLYENTAKKCETEGMEYYSQYGKTDSGCEYIAEAFPSTVASSSKAGIVIMWIIIALLVVGGAFFVYTKWWMKRKQGSASLTTSDGVAA